MLGAQLARLALQIIAQQFHFIAGRRRDLPRRIDRLRRRGNKQRLAAGKTGIARLRRFHLRRRQMLGHGIGRRYSIARQDLPRLGKCGWIGHRRTGGYDRRIIARHIGYQQTDDTGRGRRRGQPAPLDGGEMLAHYIHLVDRRAAAQQGLIDRLFVTQIKAGGGQAQQRGTTARNQHQQQIVRAQIRGKSQNTRRRSLAGGIGHRVGGLDNLDRLGRTA